MTDLTKEQLEIELGRAYRALRGLYGCVVNGEQPGDTMMAYHSPTFGAAVRFVNEQKMDGAEYFIGKHFSVLADVLKSAVKEPA